MGRTCLADRNRPEIIHFIISTRIKLRGRLRKGHFGQVCLTPQHRPEIIKVMLGIRAKHPRGLGAAREKKLGTAPWARRPAWLQPPFSKRRSGGRAQTRIFRIRDGLTHPNLQSAEAVGVAPRPMQCFKSAVPVLFPNAFSRTACVSARKKVGNGNRVSSEQAKHCFGLHRTHLLIKLQTWSWHSGCRRSTVTKPSQNDATQSQDAHGWKRQMSLSDNRRPYWTWTLAKHELNPGSPHETQATMG